MKITARERLRIAKHEAGHAIAALHFGTEFIHVWITNAKDTKDAGETAGAVVFTERHMCAHDFSVACMAGVAGERCNREKSGSFGLVEHLRGANTDWNQAYGAIAEITLEKFDRDGFVQKCFREAHSLIRKHQRAHARIVEGLMSLGVVSYDTCVEILEESR